MDEASWVVSRHCVSAKRISLGVIRAFRLREEDFMAVAAAGCDASAISLRSSQGRRGEWRDISSLGSLIQA